MFLKIMICWQHESRTRDEEPRSQDAKNQRMNTKEYQGSKKEYKKIKNLNFSFNLDAFEIFYLEFIWLFVFF